MIGLCIGFPNLAYGQAIVYLRDAEILLVNGERPATTDQVVLAPGTHELVINITMRIPTTIARTSQQRDPRSHITVRISVENNKSYWLAVTVDRHNYRRPFEITFREENFQ